MQIEEGVLLSPCTTFGIGGPARFFVRAQSVEDMHAARAVAAEKNVPVLVLGGGSNVLIDDAGFEGLVLKSELKGVQLLGTVLIAEGGEQWDDVVQYAIARGLWGLENLSGIPGLVGAAPVQNIGAYGAECSQTLLWVDALNMHTGAIERFEHTQCNFGYRTSRFKQTGGHLIVQVAFSLSEAPAPNVSYKDLQIYFSGQEAPSLSAIRAAVLAIRAGKFPDLQQEGTAGSFFLNPTVSKKDAARLLVQFPDWPHFPAADGIKFSLAYLLDVLGLKGLAVGGARLFEKQPLVIVAARGTSAREVRALQALVEKKVFEACGIAIEPEVRSVPPISV